MERRVHIVVSGKVQGVLFRSNINNHAANLRLKGFVKNIGHDKLEAVFEGESHMIDEMLEFCKDGPENAEVSAIIIDEEQATGEFKNFSILE